MLQAQVRQVLRTFGLTEAGIDGSVGKDKRVTSSAAPRIWTANSANSVCRTCRFTAVPARSPKESVISHGLHPRPFGGHFVSQSSCGCRGNALVPHVRKERRFVCKGGEEGPADSSIGVDLVYSISRWFSLIKCLNLCFCMVLMMCYCSHHILLFIE